MALAPPPESGFPVPFARWIQQLWDTIRGKTELDASLGTVANTKGTQTFLNKSLTAAALTGATTIGTGATITSPTISAPTITSSPSVAPAVLFFGAATTSNDTTIRYLYPGYSSGIASTTVIRLAVPSAGKVGKLAVGLGTAPGSAMTITVMLDGVATAVTCTIASGAFQGTDNTNTFTLSANQNVGIRIQLAGATGAPADIFASVLLTQA